MSRENNLITALDTLDVIKKGYYTINGRKVKLNGLFSDYDFENAVALSPEKLESIMRDDDEKFEKAFFGSEHCSFYVVNADSFEAASSFSHCVVMNFANAHTPGGGFLKGSSAQEESLCRCSTLYASISSEKAKEMYDYNKSLNCPTDSDFMLLSKDVCVFKDRFGNYLENPFYTSVITVPAPNINGRACSVDKEKIHDVIMHRLMSFLFACAYNGYRDIVLGAWGCGAFGNNPYEVAGCFYELFFGELQMEEFFDNVVFAILGEGENYNAFKTVFGNKAENFDCESESKVINYTEALYNRPICNHSPNNIDENNLGYTFGVFSDGVPFEAELWKNDSEINVSFYLPDILIGDDNSKQPETEETELPFSTSNEYQSNTVLCVGMAEREPEFEYDVADYVDYLINMGAVSFLSSVQNGGLSFYTDIEGNNIVCVHITLEGIENVRAETKLHFREFPGVKRKTKLHKI